MQRFASAGMPPWKPTLYATGSQTSRAAPSRSGGIFDFAGKRDRLEEVNRELENPRIWDDPERAQSLGRERARLASVVTTLTGLQSGLSDAADRSAKTYSGGMRRRLDLAASLVGRPDILFLDEPTTGLDPRSRADVWEFVRELKDEGTTLMLTTQYLEEADQLADRIAVIDVGSVIAEGTSDELKDQIGGEVLELHVIDRADLEFESFLLEVLSDFQVTVPEIGTIVAAHRPYVVLTSNRSRDLSDALRRRCLYLWIDYPSFEKEAAIVRAHVPGASARLTSQVTAAVQALRSEDLYKKPGVSETIDWVAALVALDRDALDASTVDETLGVVLKAKEDLDTLRGPRADALVDRVTGTAREEPATPQKSA